MTTTMTRALRAAEAELAGKKAALRGILDEAGPAHSAGQIRSLPGGTGAKIAQVHARRAEIDALEEQLTMAKAAAAAGAGGFDRSIGERIAASRAVKGRGVRGADGMGPQAGLDVDLKALFTSTAGWAPDIHRVPRYGTLPTGSTDLIDIVPVTPTDSARVQYMAETTLTNPVAERNEAAAYSEASIVLTVTDEPIRSVGTWVPATDELLEDDTRAAAYLDERVPLLVRQRLNAEMIAGTGTAPNLRGYLNVSGVQTQARGADTGPDAIRKALTKVRLTGHAAPSAIVLHPTDWQAIQLLKDSAGSYLFPRREMFDVPVIESEAITLGTGLVGAFAEQSELVVRRGVTVQVSYSHGTFFTESKVAIRVDTRCALVVYRAAAFATVTGL